MTPTSISRARRPRAYSLVEILVSSAIMAMVSASAFYVLQQGMQYYRANQTALDAQRDGLNLLSHIHAELENSRMSLVVSYVSSGQPDGVVFLDPFGNDLRVTYNSGSAQIDWQRYICYFLDAPNQKLYRREKPLSPPTPTPDLTALASLGTAQFAADTTLSTRLVASTISLFQVTQSANILNVTLEAGDPNDQNGFWVRLQTGVSPRN